MYTFKRLALFAILLIGSQNLFSHALWIETDSQGEEGRTHSITIFYAEPEDTREVIADWWSDTANFTLWLISPEGESEKLFLQKGEDNMQSSFIPKTPGVYKLAIHHNVAQLAGDTQYQFNASASVIVGNPRIIKDFDTNTTDNELFLQYIIDSSTKKSKTISILLLEGKTPVSKNEITVIAPNGWQKTIKTDERGIANVEAEWLGKYIFEGFKTEEVPNQEFTKKVRIITLLVEIE